MLVLPTTTTKNRKKRQRKKTDCPPLSLSFTLSLSLFLFLFSLSPIASCPSEGCSASAAAVACSWQPRSAPLGGERGEQLLESASPTATVSIGADFVLGGLGFLLVDAVQAVGQFVDSTGDQVATGRLHGVWRPLYSEEKRERSNEKR